MENLAKTYNNTDLKHGNILHEMLILEYLGGNSHNPPEILHNLGEIIRVVYFRYLRSTLQ